MSNNEVFKALSDPTRREILRLLGLGEMSAGQLTEKFDMTKPSMSHHFAVLKDADLITAVKNKTIAGAILDVFRQEPLPKDHPFWAADGILVLPHIGGPHPHRDSIVAKLFVDNLGRFLDGQPLKEVVDRSAGY